jgi:hypothetical protein
MRNYCKIISIDVGYKNLAMCYMTAARGSIPPIIIHDLRREDCLDGKKKQCTEKTSKMVSRRIYDIVKNQYFIAQGKIAGNDLKNKIKIVIESQVKAAPINIALGYVIKGTLYGLIGHEHVDISFMPARKKFDLLQMPAIAQCVSDYVSTEVKGGVLPVDNLKKRAVIVSNAIWDSQNSQNSEIRNLFSCDEKGLCCAQDPKIIFSANKKKADDLADALLQGLTFCHKNGFFGEPQFETDPGNQASGSVGGGESVHSSKCIYIPDSDSDSDDHNSERTRKKPSESNIQRKRKRNAATTSSAAEYDITFEPEPEPETEICAVARTASSPAIEL